MKTIIIVFFLSLLTLSCNKAEEGVSPSQSSPNKRIHIVENPGFGYAFIVEVDGHLYLGNNQGGIVHMESCPCKTREQ